MVRSRKISRKTSRKISRKTTKPLTKSTIKPSIKTTTKSRTQMGGGGNKCEKFKPQSGVWTVFGFSYCGFYHAALDLLKKKKQKFIKIDIDRSDFGCFSQIGSHRTSPIVFNPMGKFIGGFDALSRTLP